MEDIKMNKIEGIIKNLVETCDARLSNPGYEEYIKEHLGEAIDVAKHDGCLIDFDNIVYLKEQMGMNVSYEMYSYIDSCFDCSLLDVEIKEELFEVLEDYIGSF